MSQSSGQTGSIGEWVKGIWDGDEGSLETDRRPKVHTEPIFRLVTVTLRT